MPDDDGDENSTRRAWMSFFPPGTGYVSMSKIRDAGEVPLVYKHMETDGSGRFCVAAFHQLHCLYLIHVALQRAVRGLEGDFTKQQPETNLEESHTLHCVDYLRESIMCTADNNLEPFGPETEGKGVDGFGSVHQCRDWGALFDWSKRFRYNDQGDAERFEG
ncbi:hypothetical protein QBC37DRAFT_416156 [Rhypophila decipiens]|uniref:Oxidase ustYa n=1 Tax=Rhypophila decipiens TaxID=261697 RepID=A0AAN7BB43_9PEZI|nr:hypothetical protein QBC37DRAFT_416156 [Rhypophila decipiens]